MNTTLGINVESIKDIAINKLDTILTRQAARDYFDLYTIMNRENISLTKLRKWHFKKIEHQIHLKDLVVSFLKSAEISELPKIKVRFSLKKMVNFYQQLAKSLESEIFK